MSPQRGGGCRQVTMTFDYGPPTADYLWPGPKNQVFGVIKNAFDH
jgi:hypothetical protein